MWKTSRIKNKPYCLGSLRCDVHQGFMGAAGAAAEPWWAGGWYWRGVDASELFLLCMGGRGSNLGGQVVREWWCWGGKQDRVFLL